VVRRGSKCPIARARQALQAANFLSRVPRAAFPILSHRVVDAAIVPKASRPGIVTLVTLADSDRQHLLHPQEIGVRSRGPLDTTLSIA
jgi:hypothetical protein